jgi:hypothetical protein
MRIALVILIMSIALVILIMSMSKPPPHFLVRKELIIMRRKRKRSKLSNLSPCKIQTRSMTRK